MVRRSWITLAALVLIPALVVVGCTSDPPPVDPSSSVGSSPGSPSTESTATDGASGVGTVQLAGLKVDVAGSLTLTAAASQDPAPDTSQLKQLATDLNAQVSPPVELTASSTLPDTGALLTRTYPSPLPPDAVAAFLYFDPATSLWTAVPSTLSSDRTVLTATVNHFSTWDDIWYSIGKVTDQRVDPPKCSGDFPSWLARDNGVLYADDNNLPLLWCAEKDSDDNLVVKARVNRGYGIALKSTIAPLKSTNSFLDVDVTSFYNWVTDSAGQLAATSTFLNNLIEGNSQEVPGKGEATFTFTEEQVRSAKDGGVGLVYADQPSPVQSAFAISIAFMQKLLPDSRLVAITTALVTLIHCESQIIATQNDPLAYLHTVLSCLYDQVESIKTDTEKVVNKASPGIPDVKGSADKAIHGLMRLLAVGYFGISLGQYLIDTQATDAAAYAFSAYPAPIAQEVTDATLLSAPVPALRGNPAGNLINGSLPNPFASGSVELVQTGGGSPAHGDLNGDGVKDAAATIDATSGAGGLDQYVELYTDGNNRFAEWDMAAAVHADHAFVTAMLIRDGHVLVDGSAEHLPNGPETYWSARLHWDGQQLNAELQDGNTGITNSGLWSDSQLIITPTSLGAVKIGMSLAEVNAAAGVNVDPSGDGVYDSTQMPPNSLHLYIQGQTVTCVGAGTRTSATQQVATKEGVAVGDPVSKVLSTYPQATFVPPPADGGRTINAGYVISSSDGDLAFILDSANTTITAITGGQGLTPNSCAG